MKEKQLSPQKARTEKQIESLRTDNYDSGSCWILLNGKYISLGMGINTSYIRLPKKDFNRLIKWYQREQKTVKR